MKQTKQMRLRVLSMLLLLLTLLSVSCQTATVKDPDGSREEQSELPTSDSGTTADPNGEKPDKPKKPAEEIANNGIISYTAGEGLLYNGIRLPQNWPTATDPMSDDVVTPPYLLSRAEGGYRPDVIDITVGRQLFVDDFLIESTNLKTVYHTAKKYEGNPVLKPSTVSELQGYWGVGLSAGGVWYDMQDHKYKMWYDVAFNWGLGYAESVDGINWTRINCVMNDKGKLYNVVMDNTQKNGTCSVFIDYEANPSEKYKMYMHSFNNHTDNLDGEFYTMTGNVDENAYADTLYVSADGINWRQVGGLSSGAYGDQSTAFYNAFTHKWVNSLRGYASTTYRNTTFVGRARWYAERDTFLDLLTWTVEDALFWLKCDENDKAAASGKPPQVYNFNAIAYESIMFGGWQIWYGPENNFVETSGNPKITEIIASYSRDGYYFDRPDRTSFIPASRTDGTWDKGYVFSSPGAMIVHDDEIWFYYSAMSGYAGNVKNGHANSQIGLAILRRDGFASMEGKGELLTRKLTVNNGKKYLFVNIDTPEKSFRAEILDANGNVVNGFSMEDCIAVGGDDTRLMITWKNGKDLSFLNGTEFQICFSMDQDGKFYSFWLSDSTNGESGGAVGSGYVSQ